MDKTFTATLHGATRTRNSTNGNPGYILHTDAGDHKTGPDSAIGYEVSNRTGGPGSWINKRVRFTATRTGKVFAWTLAE